MSIEEFIFGFGLLIIAAIVYVFFTLGVSAIASFADSEDPVFWGVAWVLGLLLFITAVGYGAHKSGLL